MTNYNLEKAKKLFIDHKCSHFYMERDDVYDEYKRYDVPESQEMIWVLEYQLVLLGNIMKDNVADYDFFALVEMLEGHFDSAIFLKFIKVVKQKTGKLDTYTIVVVAEQLLKLASKLSVDNNSVVSEAKHVAVSMLKESITKPITIAPYYFDLGYLDDLLEEGKISERIKKVAEAYGVNSNCKCTP